MNHEDLLEGVRSLISDIPADYGQFELLNALEAVINLHKPKLDYVGRPLCSECTIHLTWKIYPCATIKAIVGAIYVS